LKSFTLHLDSVGIAFALFGKEIKKCEVTMKSCQILHSSGKEMSGFKITLKPIFVSEAESAELLIKSFMFEPDTLAAIRSLSKRQVDNEIEATIRSGGVNTICIHDEGLSGLIPDVIEHINKLNKV